MAHERPRFQGPPNNGLPPPERGGSRFHAIVTRPPDRGGTIAPTLPRETPPPPVQDQVIKEMLEQALRDSGDVFEQPRKTGNNRMLIKAGSFVAAGLALTAAAWGAKTVYEDNTSSANSQTRSVDSFPNSFNTETLKPIERFDNKARSGEIKTIKRISKEETAKLDSFAKIDDHNTVLAIYPIDVSTSTKPDVKIKYERGYENYSGNDKDLIDFQGQGYFPNFRFEQVPAGSTVLSPVDGRLFLFREKDATNDHPYSKAVIEFQPREDEIFVMTISGRSTKASMINPKDDVFRSITDAPAYESSPVKSDTSPSILEVIEQAIPVKKGQPIMQTATEINVGFDITFSARPDTDPSKFKKVGERIVNGQKINDVRVPSTHLKLFLSEDDEIVQPQLPTN